MKKEIRQYFQAQYDSHSPSTWGSCKGDHEASGYEYSPPEHPCELHKAAAHFLRLPEIVWVRPPRVIRPFNALFNSALVKNAYEKLILHTLKPEPFFDNLIREPAVDNGSVTFQITSEI